MNLSFLGFTLGILGAWGVIKNCDKIGVTDIPNGRSSHDRAIPKCGGIGILFSLVLGSIILGIPEFFWLPSLVISLVSFWGGDKHLLSPKQRLIFQFGCSLYFLFLFLLSFQAESLLYLLCIPLSIFIVGTANFYNFMDGIDGIAGITGVVAFSLLTVYNSINSSIDIYSTVGMMIACSCLGFLCFNVPKAKVFLGDIGSILLGFVFACLVVLMSENLIDFLIMAGFLSTFYFDEIFTMIFRIKSGDSLTEAHRKHIYQLLANELGIEHWKVSLMYGACQLVIGVLLIYLKSKGIGFLLSAYLVFSSLFILAGINIHKKVSVE